jgi:hypothetical protein
VKASQSGTGLSKDGLALVSIGFLNLFLWAVRIAPFLDDAAVQSPDERFSVHPERERFAFQVKGVDLSIRDTQRDRGFL